MSAPRSGRRSSSALASFAKFRIRTRPKRYEYIPTQGLDLYPIIMSIVHWGNIHMVRSRGRPLLYEHRNCHKMFDPVMVCSECGEPLTAKAIHVHPGPGARKPARAGGAFDSCCRRSPPT
ncbi:hypothetical protein ABIA94_007780 [Bradyrhizobium sp. LA7.1]